MNIHFVIPPQFAKLSDELPVLEIERNYPYWLGGQFNWAAQSWLVLRQFREGFTFGVVAKPGVINFGHSFTWRGIRQRTGEFRVGVRADYRRVFDIDFEILQNPSVKLSPTQAYLPYWPIPGHISRRTTRLGLQTIAYAGRIGQRNLAADVRSGAWRKGLDGLDFVVIPPDKWHDMSEVDLLIAVRTFDRQTYPDKPPSKLFNAWRSSVPLVAGFDSAFSMLGRPGLDYVRVGSTEEFTQAIVRLREDKSCYDRIVSDGRRQAAEVSHERLAMSWLDVFDHRIVPAYETWLQKGGPTRCGALAQTTDRIHDLASALRTRFSSRWGSRSGKSSVGR